MMERWHAVGRLLHHWLREENEQSIHSPYLFRFYQTVIRPEKPGDSLDRRIEELRARKKQSHERIQFSSLGTPSGWPSNGKTIGRITRRESLPQLHAALLRRLVQFKQSRNILELGTSLGFTTMYMALPGAHVTTLEGHPDIARTAQEHFTELRYRNIDLVHGEIDATLPRILGTGFQPDLTLVDANHRYDATMRYLNKIVEAAPSGAVLVMDDINYSREMSRAWKEALHLPKISVGINMGRMGILLMDPECTSPEVFWSPA